MITLRKFFIGLLALTALVVVAYAVYELTPERRARRVAARWKRLGDEDPGREIPELYYGRRSKELVKELFDVACRCEPPLDETTRPLLGAVSKPRKASRAVGSLLVKVGGRAPNS